MAASTNALLLRGTFEPSRLSSGINLRRWNQAEPDLQEKVNNAYYCCIHIFVDILV